MLLGYVMTMKFFFSFFCTEILWGNNSLKFHEFFSIPEPASTDIFTSKFDYFCILTSLFFFFFDFSQQDVTILDDKISSEKQYALLQDKYDQLMIEKAQMEQDYNTEIDHLKLQVN